MRTLILLTIVFLSYINLIAQQSEPFEKVTKQYTLELGVRSITHYSDFNNKASMGEGVLFDYAWKLSGYNKKKNAYISVPIGFYIFNADKKSEANEVMRILNYGWTVRHELRKDKKVIPFIGYGLLLNQLWINKIDGNAIGHQTKFEFGANYTIKGKNILFGKIEYSMMRFPSLNNQKAMKISSSDINIGFRF